MAKFIKSMFTADKRRSMRFDEELEGETETPPLDSRRKLSMSRSGRLKQSYKKRQQLSVDVYGGEDLHATERPKTMEYHVNTPAPEPPISESYQPKSDPQISSIASQTEPAENSDRDGSKSPEEEIDSAFEMIDKS